MEKCGGRYWYYRFWIGLLPRICVYKTGTHMTVNLCTRTRLLHCTCFQCCGSRRIRNFWPDPDLIRNRNKRFGSEKICKKEHYFQAEISWFHMIIHISHLQVEATIAVQRKQVVVRSVVDSWLFGTNLDPHIRASYKWIRILQIYCAPCS